MLISKGLIVSKREERNGEICAESRKISVKAKKQIWAVEKEAGW